MDWTPVITVVGILLSFYISNRTAKSAVNKDLSEMIANQTKANLDLQASNRELENKFELYRKETEAQFSAIARHRYRFTVDIDTGPDPHIIDQKIEALG
jgi:cell division protein FtsB